MEVRKVVKEVMTFFFFFFFFLLFTFEKDRNLFWVYQNGNFLPGKKHFTQGKKSGKMTLPPPPEKYVCSHLSFVTFNCLSN